MDWMSVGDSRIYILRRGSMVAVTRDHNYRRELEDMLQSGTIDRGYYEQEIRTRKAEALTSYLGMDGLRRMERNTQPFSLEDGDLIMMCSDGVYKSLAHEQMQAMLEDNSVNTQVAARRLVKMALAQAKRSQDNTTAIVIEYHTYEEDKTDGPLL
jgi:protein phosphatase